MNHPLRKPHWLPRDDWNKLLALHHDAPRCAECGTADFLSVDHIQPRKYRGTDDLGNLQFLCVPHNSRKGVRSDRYWSQGFYWDQVPELSGMRTAQRKVYEAITLDPDVAGWFAQPASMIAGKIYILGWIVGAGKTLAIPAVTLAFNQVLRRRWEACRRADRILVLTKEQSIRDGLARDLSKEVSGYGILPQSPRVCILEKDPYSVKQDLWLEEYDVVVSCIQMFWDKKRNGINHDDLVAMLGKFPLIFIDEPHFAPDQVRHILDSAPRSVIFGMTGSPIDRDCNIIRDYILLSSYTYQDAHKHDGSLKYLNKDEAIRDKFVRVVPLDEADIFTNGVERTVSNIHDPDYDVDQLVPAQQIVSAVIREMERCDNELVGRPADHRDPERVAADLLYPAHAIIRCQNIALAKALCKQANSYFELHRKRHPEPNGWKAEVIHTGTDDTPAKGLDPEKHPWMRAKNRGLDVTAMRYRCVSGDARILFVVGMAREGVNNPLCCISAAAERKNSTLIVVQGHIGRPGRAISHVDDDGIRHVPPGRLDTIQIFKHEAHAGSGFNDGIEFVMNMGRYLSQLPAIGDLINGHPISVVDPGVADDPLTTEDRVDIAAACTVSEGDRWRTDPDAVERIKKKATEEYAPLNEKKAARVSQWVNQLRDDPAAAWRATGHVSSLEELEVVPVVLGEREKLNPTLDELRDWLRWNKPDTYAALAASLANPGPETLLPLEGWYKEWAQDRVMPQPQADENIEDIRRRIARRVIEHLGPYIDGDIGKAKSAAHAYVGAAVKRIFTVPEGESAGNNSPYNKPQHHIVLQRPDVDRTIRGFVRARMILDGYCPQIASAFKVEFA
jgi:hypothetical protein